jgi:hypothetical protein
MIAAVIDETGRDRIAILVSYELARLGMTRTRMRKEWSHRVSSGTVDRIRTGKPAGEQYLAALGDLLGMPRGFLQYVGRGDVERIKASGADADLIRWTLTLLDAESAAG